MSTPSSVNGPRTTSAPGWDDELTEILVDSGPLIAGFDDTDVWHAECSRLLETLPGPLIVPATIVAEVCYTITRSYPEQRRDAPSS